MLSNEYGDVACFDLDWNQKITNKIWTKIDLDKLSFVENYAGKKTLIQHLIVEYSDELYLIGFAQYENKEEN